MNFNKKDPGLIAPMRAAIDAMVEAPYLWQWLKHYDGAAQQEFNRNTAGLVDTVRLRAAFEEDGKQNHGLHVHIVIEIGHRTMVQISKAGLCDLFRRLVGENPNVHCRFVRGDGEDKDFILRYITKEVPTYKPRSQLNSRLKYALSNPHNEQMEAESNP